MIQINPAWLMVGISVAGMFVGAVTAVVTVKVSLGYIAREFARDRELNDRDHANIFRDLGEHGERLASVEAVCEERGKKNKC